MQAVAQEFRAAVQEYTWEHAPVFLARFDAAGHLSEANRYAEDLIKGSASRTVGDIFLDFSGTLSLERLAASSGPHLLDIARAGDTPLTLVCRVYRVADHSVVCGAVDLGEATRMQEQVLLLNRELNNTTRELHKSHAELAVLNRLKNQFLGMAAHDLRKPVGIIETYVGFVLDEASDTLAAEHIGFLRTIRDMGRNMSRLIDDFLDVSIIESGKLELRLEASHMERVLDRVRTLIGPAAQRAGVTLHVQASGSVPPVVMDPGKIEQVLANLVSNAVEYSPAGATVLIQSAIADGTVVLSVQDHGPGISDEQKGTLFNAFARGKTVKAGHQRSVGLGLMISKKIVDAHDGQIRLDSEAGKGSTFVVTLPVSGPARGQAA